MATAEAVHSETPHDGHDHDHPEWLAHHFETPEQQFDAGKLGIWLFLAQEVLFFTGLFVAYAVYRMNHPEVFIGASQFLNPTLGALNTIVLLASSLAVAWGVRAAQKNQQELLLWLHIFTLACAGLFMGVKVVEYSYKFDEGLFWAGRYNFNPAGLEAGDALNAQLPWVFIGSALVGGAVMFGGWMMYQLRSAKGALLAGLGWGLMIYVSASALATGWSGSIVDSQQADADAAKAEAETALMAYAEAPPTPAEADPAAGPSPVDQAVDALNRYEGAEQAIWSNTTAGLFWLLVTVALSAIAGGVIWWFMGRFRGDRGAWGAVALGLGACIVGMAMGIVVARGIQAGADAGHDSGHHGDTAHGDTASHAGEDHAGEEHAAADHTDEGQAGENQAGEDQAANAADADAAPAEEAPTARSALAKLSEEVGGEEPLEDRFGEAFSSSSETPAAGAAPTAAATAQIGVNQGNFFSIYFAMTGVHALHIFAGIVVIAWIIGRIARGDFSPAFYGPVEFTGLYWHLVDLVWIFLFPLLYLIHD